MTSDFSKTKFRNPSIEQTSDKTVSFSFDNASNCSINYRNTNRRNRAGKIAYEEVVEKISGATLKKTPNGTGAAKGGFKWVSPSEVEPNKTRIIFAYNNYVYMYVPKIDTLYFLRDVGVTDSKTISFLNGVQSKKYGYISIGDTTDATNLYTYAGSITGTTASVANNAGVARFTDVAHGLQTGNTITVTGSVYNGTTIITKVTDDVFDTSFTYVSNDTGTWVGETLTKSAMTGLNATKYVGLGENRIMGSGVGEAEDVSQYSYASATGQYSNFTSSTDIDEGGTLTGILNSITGYRYFKGSTYVFEKNRITQHIIKNINDALQGLIKDKQTIVQTGVIDGIGITNPKCVTEYNSTMYLISQGKGLFEYAYSSTGGKLTELTRAYRPLMKQFDFNNASIEAHPYKNQLIITCATQENVAENFNLIWNFDTESLTFVPNRMYNQTFWSEDDGKMYALGSASAGMYEIYGASYTDGDNQIETVAETRMNNMGDDSTYKSFVLVSFEVSVFSGTQSIKAEIFVDDDNTASTTFVRAASDFISVVPGNSQIYGNEPISGTPKLGNYSTGTVLFRGFVPRFQKISVRITEKSPFNFIIKQPTIHFKRTKHKLNAFSSDL